MKGYIYKITNLKNNMIYVGQTINPEKRWQKHLSVAKSDYKYKSYFYNAINKYGKENFKFEIIEECDANLLDERESFWIDKLNTITPNGYNLTPGGVYLFGENNPFFGKSHSKETKIKISKKLTGRKASIKEIEVRKIINTGQRNPFYGRKHSIETINKIVLKNKENGLYERTSERMKKNNPNKDGIHSKKTPVALLLDNGEKIIFNSTTEAGNYAKKNGLTAAKYPGNSITDVCKGRQKTAFGYRWEYVKEGVSTSENISDDMNE